MTPDDVAEVGRLDRDTHSPWTTGHFQALFAQAHTWQFAARITTTNELAGFICGQFIGDEGEIHKIAVAAPLRRQQVGRRLANHALSFLRRHGVRSCFLELRASNTPARALYHRLGFQAHGLRKKYYNSPREDAMIMRLRL